MEKIIRYDNIDFFAYSNDKHIKGDISGIVVFYRGLGSTAMISDDTTVEALKPTVERAMRFAEQNILFFIPYIDPWNWMNKQAADTVDAIIDALCEHYDLDDSIPIVSSGGSMGGQCALAYMAMAKRAPRACVVNCPVCDVPFHYTERPDLPRTFYSAYYNCDMTLEQALRAHSPLHMCDRMPRADYYVFHCEEDKAVNIHSHSEKLVRELSKTQNVIYHTVPGRGHCSLTPEMNELFDKYIVDSIKR